jgi:hypothetical protein
MRDLLAFDPDDLQLLCEKIRHRADLTAKKISKGRAGDEPDVSGQFCGRLAEVINGFEVRLMPSFGLGSSRPSGTELSAFALSDKDEVVQMRQTQRTGGLKEERESGADIIVVYQSETAGIKAHKGFLAQAKAESVSKRGFVKITAHKSDFERQCSDMLVVTDDAYVFLYTEKGLLCYHASMYKELARNGLPVEEAMNAGDIFYDFLKCRIGDDRLYHFEKEAFIQYVREQKAKGALHISDDPAHKSLINQD